MKKNKIINKEFSEFNWKVINYPQIKNNSELLNLISLLKRIKGQDNIILLNEKTILEYLNINSEKLKMYLNFLISTGIILPYKEIYPLEKINNKDKVILSPYISFLGYVSDYHFLIRKFYSNENIRKAYTEFFDFPLEIAIEYIELID